MIKLLKNGKVKIEIGSFKVQDIMNNDFISLIEDFNYGLSEKFPIILTFEMSKSYYYVICNINECYIIDSKKETIKVEKITLFNMGRTFIKIYYYNKKRLLCRII